MRPIARRSFFGLLAGAPLAVVVPAPVRAAAAPAGWSANAQYLEAGRIILSGIWVYAPAKPPFTFEPAWRPSETDAEAA